MDWSWLWLLLINMAALGITAAILPGIKVKGFWSAFLAVVVISLLNSFIRPFLEMVSLPVNILTLGLFSWIITAFIIWLTSLIIKGFQVKNFGWAILCGLVMAILNSLLTMVFPI